MCGLFINADEALWASTTRSMRIDGMVTSIRLEQYFWLTLEEIADRDDMSVAQLVTKLYLEAIDAGHDLGNFTSFLRVCCTRYLSLVADGHLIRDESLALEQVPADSILEAEKKNMQERQQKLTLQQISLGKPRMN